MRLVCPFICVLLASALGSAAGESTFYRELVSLIDTNDSMARGITSVHLTDTNSLGVKVTNAISQLSEIMASGDVAGVKLGLTAEEVVARRGKPRWIWSRCFGGPRLCYSGASVVLAPSTNRVMMIVLEALRKDQAPPFTPEACVAALGEPKLRKDYDAKSLRQFWYGAPGGTMQLEFSEDALVSARLDSR